MLISFIKKSQFYFIFSFLALILCGTLLLRLPVLRGGGTLSWVDALFTSTSAVCVTGLMTVNLTDFSFVGQVIVLLLIQLGGIGIMTMSGSILVIIGRNMSWSESKMLSQLTDNYSPNSVESLVRTIIVYTVVSEFIGMAALFVGFVMSGHPVIDAMWHSLFHSVSSFCNAGISTFPDSLVRCSAVVKIIVALLIILGGLGMYVVYDIHQSLTQHRKMRVNTKLVLLTSLILIIIGILLIKYYQYRNGQPIGWIDSFFMAVSSRTAGFNSVPMSVLSSGSILVLIFLMLIGGAPGSTAGGMKVTTFALVMAAIYNVFCGNEKVLIFKRKISSSTVLRAFTVAFTFIVLGLIGAGIFQSLSTANMQKAFFEVVSALGTVGLSLGMGDDYTLRGKLFIILYMFVGRVGPLTFMAFLLGREKKSKLLYPEEKIIIG